MTKGNAVWITENTCGEEFMFKYDVHSEKLEKHFDAILA